MSAVHLSCPHCAGILQVETHLAGRQVSCPTCHGVVTIPDFGPDMAAMMAAGQMAAPPAPAPSAGDLVQLACPHCTGAFQVLSSMAGQQVGCPHCQNAITVPEMGPPAGYGGAAPAAPDFQGPPAYSAPSTAPSSYAAGYSAPPSPATMPSPSMPGAGGGVSSGPPGSGVAGMGAGARPIPVTPKPVAGGVVRPVEPKSKTLGRGNEQVELRKLTPEEKAARRRTRNIVMGVSFVVVLFIVFAVLLAME